MAKIIEMDLADIHLARLKENPERSGQELEFMVEHGSAEKLIIFGDNSRLVQTSRGWDKLEPGNQCLTDEAMKGVL